MKLRQRVALNIQDIRRSRGMSQEMLALSASVNRGYMGKLENAKHSPTVDTLEQIANALEVDASAFFRNRSG